MLTGEAGQIRSKSPLALPAALMQIETGTV